MGKQVTKGKRSLARKQLEKISLPYHFYVDIFGWDFCLFSPG